MQTFCDPGTVTDAIGMADGRWLTVRPIRRNDSERLLRFFYRQSRESVRLRFFSPLHDLPPLMLQHLTDVDHRNRDALVAIDDEEIIGVGRYGDISNGETAGRRVAEIAVSVDDAWHRRGIARALTRRLACLARTRGYDEMVARILPENRAALALIRALAPDANIAFVSGEYEARLPTPTTTPVSRRARRAF